MRAFLFSITVAMLAACSGPAPETEAAVEMSPVAIAIAGDHRIEKERQRDPYRHPKETLEFFGLTPELSVVELWPGGGWYTKIIAPVVRGRGTYYAAHVDPDSKVEMLRLSVQKYQTMLDSSPELYDEVQMTVLMPPEQLEIAPAGSVDLVVSFRSVHNWMAFDMQDDVMQAVYNALKPGGVFGVVEHRGIEGQEQNPRASTGYVSVAAMIAMAEKAGLQFESASEVNANLTDTKDYPDGVWSLPPRLRGGEQDQQKYLDIGESDRFTLRFVKPTE
jgi:predicted methyltransferase